MDTPDRTLNLAIAATFSAGPIQPALEFWMDELGLPARIAFASVTINYYASQKIYAFMSVG